jgi:hypothetical protein
MGRTGRGRAVSTDLLCDERYGFYAARFWGGQARGTMVQLTIAPATKPDGDLSSIDQFSAYVSVPRRRFRAMVRVLARMEANGEL